MRERRFKVLQPVQETSMREERFCVQRPVYETQMRDASYDVVRNVVETAEREERYMVAKPVVETQMREERYCVQRPVTETAYQAQCQTVMRPVTNYQTRYVDQGCYVDQAYCVPGTASWPRLGWTPPTQTVAIHKQASCRFSAGGLAWTTGLHAVAASCAARLAAECGCPASCQRELLPRASRPCRCRCRFAKW